MIRSYLKIAWRNLFRNKMYGLINIAGLAIGMAVAMLIGLWVYDEVSYNRSHGNYEHIAQVYKRFTIPSEQKTNSFKRASPAAGESFDRKIRSPVQKCGLFWWEADYDVRVESRIMALLKALLAKEAYSSNRV